MATDKDTIYIDIDDEITGIIDKVKNSDGKVVALVLPKRASVFQSIVNMKLLKRAADSSKKNVALITTEAGLLPLAGAAGLHVAKTLTSKPEIPSAPAGFDDGEEEISEETGLAEEPEVTAATAGDKPVGDLAAGAAGIETVELDDDVSPEDAAAPKPRDFTPPKKNKKLKIPDFDRFRKVLIFGGLALLLLLVLLIFAMTALPHATINVKTDAENVPANLNLNLSTAATTLDPRNNTVPAKLESQQKTYSQQVPTTGQKNQGNKATGSVTITNCTSDNSSLDIPAGTPVVAGSLTYITQSEANLPYSGQHPKTSCQSQNGITSATVSIVAQSGGSSYNQNNTFTVSGYSGSTSATGSASGGSDNIVQVVNQNDINSAKSKISSSNDSVQKQILENQLKQEGLFPIAATYNASTPSVNSSPGLGQQGSSVTVTETVTFTMFGVHKSDLKTLVDTAVQTQIDTSKQSILDEGIDSAIYNVNGSTNTSAQIAMQANAEAGPQIDVSGLKQQAAGKKVADIKSQLTTNPDVTSVDVKFSPFWVTTAPKNTSRIKVVIAKPTVPKHASTP